MYASLSLSLSLSHTHTYTLTCAYTIVTGICVFINSAKVLRNSYIIQVATESSKRDKVNGQRIENEGKDLERQYRK